MTLKQLICNQNKITLKLDKIIKITFFFFLLIQSSFSFADPIDEFILNNTKKLYKPMTFWSWGSREGFNTLTKEDSKLTSDKIKKISNKGLYVSSNYWSSSDRHPIDLPGEITEIVIPAETEYIDIVSTHSKKQIENLSKSMGLSPSQIEELIKNRTNKFFYYNGGDGWWLIRNNTPFPKAPTVRAFAGEGISSTKLLKDLNKISTNAFGTYITNVNRVLNELSKSGQTVLDKRLLQAAKEVIVPEIDKILTENLPITGILRLESIARSNSQPTKQFLEILLSDLVAQNKLEKLVTHIRLIRPAIRDLSEIQFVILNYCINNPEKIGITHKTSQSIIYQLKYSKSESVSNAITKLQVAKDPKACLLDILNSR
ncbi:MAG: hypothetical protein A2381_14700 [Bdellovibrionales bacterium RIFOXYB1_FULL_37_110]|nr:MAG: hypothetical protein A2417_05185 [Bdellovibrionales bacterium RIFOXYC1_FULL_37_79]OFZ57484.1 MAG: hypothetical protein A2381_14700 [Bdellovibrionales bacterium RIFOXYB1_FULL_37_110]OFZ62716.1 MAG: hypothetical protein A2577_17020 [Bdellovibrionales bacterium RIFOXYD1_FULL_36_51]